MFSRTALTVRLYLYHTRYVLSFLSFGPSSVRDEFPATAVPGVSGYWRFDPTGLCFTPGRGDVPGGMGHSTGQMPMKLGLYFLWV